MFFGCSFFVESIETQPGSSLDVFLHHLLLTFCVGYQFVGIDVPLATEGAHGAAGLTQRLMVTSGRSLRR